MPMVFPLARSHVSKNGAGINVPILGELPTSFAHLGGFPILGAPLPVSFLIASMARGAAIDAKRVPTKPPFWVLVSLIGIQTIHKTYINKY